jgi:predicted alpha/beta superfamily hydrolase
MGWAVVTSLKDASPWQIPDAFVHELGHDGRSWRVTVARPQPAPAEGALTPVVYVLDPFGTLGAAVHIARTTSMLTNGALPPLLVVGVGPATDDFDELSRQRLFDLTPDGDDASAAAMAAAGVSVSFGGADMFLDLLVGVIAPEVESRYAGDPSDRTLAGGSLGGLAAAHALLTRPAAFRRYLLVSPSLFWGNARVLSSVAGLSATTSPLDVYIGTGELEETDADRVWPPMPADAQALMSNAKMITNMRSFGDQLRSLGRGGLTVQTEALRGEHHATVWPAAFHRGLLALHAPSYRLNG